ncbi:hypothetical protein NZD89_08565 [Alicyclobacillus fastidiosus]|uniref:Uncharacterized protein n=1 Tax=Alicyclobacillus fastidiosus TaxID=392011 RepID=A0ABY6ZKL9_9BACL|nr:hypothetical protein [Alicyclobacillus fastidiosus]WAH43422.1 hypothetical protein NZD89_08565 [Alicyclobacillus fastidiosus]GMA59569.1 hypothetical protein GCM10025859_00090 [Alicyclobacillus fastidiosus]GMA65496.1 hypothetical protein GCM10025859_59360 [Alicyclobacillus fastidiosus]
MQPLHTVHTGYADVLNLVEQSIKAEQVFCSIVTQMKYLPQFKGQTALNIVHRENYETSYHRNTAAGNLERLVTGESDELLILMTVECFIETRQHDKIAGTSLGNIVVTSSEDQQWIIVATEWHKQRRQYLKSAARVLRTLIGPELWNKGASMVEGA